jgi:hypothetical protein
MDPKFLVGAVEQWNSCTHCRESNPNWYWTGTVPQRRHHTCYLCFNSILIDILTSLGKARQTRCSDSCSYCQLLADWQASILKTPVVFDLLALEDGTDRLSRNVGTDLPFNAAQLTSWSLKIGPIGCSETSVQNYNLTLRNGLLDPWT